MTPEPAKRPAGRPRHHDAVLWLRLPNDLRAAIVALARLEERPISTMLRILLQEACLARHAASQAPQNAGKL